ncbi:capsule biosynthesis GfcC family protein [Halomonas mongoliensis]|uniref:Capsule biosynthesis GfcC family protein n=1 Tax=Halomonas mongoliensis TaxID=321265 RepID=A0ABU1GP24_9GAMM|nr:capsule biosynthesis GfcC family protein [Halomonas mongoliensis]MDR5893277.1 capsule biosynthesis GfcC family protein [Halomonas mongoliensis]
MVVTAASLKGWLAAALLAGPLLAASAAQAQVPAPPSTLAEAWMAQLERENAPVAWSHSVALRRDSAARLPERRARLVEELTTLVVSARVAGKAPLAAGLSAWAETLAADDPLAGRTPGRFDLPWLGANLRHDPPLAALADWGLCAVPDWVEVWSLAGVTRLPWRPGLSLTQLMSELPRDARARADHAAVIDPLGQVRRLGIAAWNREESSLAPGSRVMVQLPGAQGLSGALPFPGTTVESDLINERLPAYLATRLPSDDCTLQGKGEDE